MNFGTIFKTRNVTLPLWSDGFNTDSRNVFQIVKNPQFRHRGVIRNHGSKSNSGHWSAFPLLGHM